MQFFPLPASAPSPESHQKAQLVRGALNLLGHLIVRERETRQQCLEACRQYREKASRLAHSRWQWEVWGHKGTFYRVRERKCTSEVLPERAAGRFLGQKQGSKKASYWLTLRREGALGEGCQASPVNETVGPVRLCGQRSPWESL